MDYPLSFGIGQQGGFTGNPMPTMSSLDSTPTLGAFSGAGGMDPATMMMLAQALGKIGGAQQQGISAPMLQHTAPQAMLGAGAQARPQMLAAGLNRFQGV